MKNRSFATCFLFKREIFLPLLAVIFNFAIYFLGKALGAGRPALMLALPFEDKIPFIHWTVAIYLGCYLFWAVSYIYAVKLENGQFSRFILAHFLGETVCFLFFIFLPTTMPRPEVVGNGLWEWLLRLQYSADTPYNLLPSIHCFAAWLSWIGVRGRREVPRWWRVFSLVFAVAICVSTLTVKQHVIVDIPAGILLAEVSYLASGSIKRALRPAR